MIVRTEKEVREVQNQACALIDEGRTKWRNMTYEEGVDATIRWLFGDQDETPMED